METKIINMFSNMIKIYIKHCQFFGLVTFNINTNGFYHLKSLFFYNILLQVVFLSFDFYFIYIVLEFNNMLPIYKTIYMIILFSDVTYLETTWICSLIKKDKIIKLLTKLIEFDVECQTIKSVFNYKKNKKIMMNHLIVRYICLASVVITFRILAITIKSNKISLASGIIMVCNSALSYQSTEIILMLKTRFEFLNKQIRHLLRTPYNNINNKKLFTTFCKICFLHQHLCKSVKLFNNVFGVPLLVLFGNSFLSIILSLFFTAAELQATQIQWEKVIHMALASIPFIFDALYVCDVCYSTIETVIINFRFYEKKLFFEGK